MRKLQFFVFLFSFIEEQRIFHATPAIYALWKPALRVSLIQNFSGKLPVLLAVA